MAGRIVVMRSDLVVNLHRDFFRHPKTQKLKRRSGKEGVFALIHLWAWTATYRPTGHLTNMDDDDWALALDVEDPHAIIDVLVDVKFLDRTTDGYAIHDWFVHNPWIKTSPQRKKWADELNHQRWHVERKQTEPDCALCFPQSDNESMIESVTESVTDSMTDDERTLFETQKISRASVTDSMTESRTESKSNQIKLNPKDKESDSLRSSLSVTRKRATADEKENAAHEPSKALRSFADAWNSKIAKPWGHRKVTKLDRDMDKKLASIAKHLRQDAPQFEPVDLIDAAVLQQSALKGKSWFQFKNFFFKHDYLQKSENLFTGFYASLGQKGARTNNGGASRFDDDERQRFKGRKFDPVKHLPAELKRQRDANLPSVQRPDKN